MVEMTLFFIADEASLEPLRLERVLFLLGYVPLCEQTQTRRRKNSISYEGALTPEMVALW